MTDEEAKKLSNTFKKTCAHMLNDMTTGALDQRVVFLKLEDAHLESKLGALPLMSDGARKVFHFNAGLDCTKEPAVHSSIFRMKAQADEQHITTSFTLLGKFMQDGDRGIFISGRNSRIYKDMLKEARSRKPSWGVKELVLEVDEEAIQRVLHTNKNSSGTVDMSDPYLKIYKTPSAAHLEKSVARRFTKGHTAFRTMGGLPLMTRDMLARIPVEAREAVFRGLAATDKYNPGLNTTKRGQACAAPNDGINFTVLQ